MHITSAKQNDATCIAHIHHQEINQGFLRTLGIPFLTILYQALIISHDSFAVIAKENNAVIGFATGTTDIKKFYKFFIKNYGFRAFATLLPKLFTYSMLKKLFAIVAYPHRKQNLHLPNGELLTLAIDRKYHGTGMAHKLVNSFITEMKKRKISKFKVVVGESLPRAIRFYEKMGFSFHGYTAVHKEKQSRIYTYTL